MLPLVIPDSHRGHSFVIRWFLKPRPHTLKAENAISPNVKGSRVIFCDVIEDSKFNSAVFLVLCPDQP